MLGELVGAASNLIGGFLNRDAAKEAQAKQEEIANRNIYLQGLFAQNGIQWKVDDAKKAGIHPLYALGANTTSFSPVSVGTVQDTSGTNFAAAGQDISRAINSTRTAQGRTDAFTKTVEDLQLTRMGLENQLLSSQIAKINAAPNPAMQAANPTTLLDGQSATDLTTVGGAPVSADKIEQKADSIPALKRIRPGGVPVYTNPHFTDAQDLEDRYGEVGEWVGGIVNLGADGAYTLHQRLKKSAENYPKAQKKANRYFDYMFGRR